MRTLSVKTNQLPPLTRMAAGGFTLAGVLAVGSLAFITKPLGLFVLLGGAVLVAIASTVMLFSKRKTAAKKAARFSGALSGAIKSDRGEAMSRSELLDAINEGIDTIKSARRSIYFRPWYLVVGPAGVGKTEAIRNSGVDLPKLRKDPLQGLGGTRTMHWWFANDAVIIDTAGRLFDAPDDSPLVDRWNEFLKMLRNARKECPINGLIVVISAEDLLRDDWKAHAADKAPHFARQLERIQRSLGRLRFPVYLMVTKCDLVPGFQAFMREIGDRDLQQQIFGWSKPGEPDEPMSADDAARGLETLIDRIRSRRDLILPHTTGNLEADPWKNLRLDRVDELFVFPREFARLIEPVRAYLEGMLTQDAWSSGQLYFRGVYFTTSLQDGRVLDKALAKATGRKLNDLPKVETEDSKPFFLRDLFTEKVFREQGLVSEADSLKKQRTARTATVLATAAALLALLTGLVITGYLRFDATVGRHANAWAAIADDVQRGGAVEATFVIDAADERVVRLDNIQREPASQRLPATDDGKTLERDEQLRPIAPILASAIWSKQPIEVPWEFAWIGPIFGNWGGDLLADERTAAHRALVEGRILAPMVRAAYRRAADYAALDPAAPLSPAQREADERALGALLALHTLAAGLEPGALRSDEPEAFLQQQIVGPLFAMVRPLPPQPGMEVTQDAPAEAAPRRILPADTGSPTPSSAEHDAWSQRLEPALRHITLEALTTNNAPALLERGSPLRRTLGPDPADAGRRMLTPRGETVPIDNTVIIRAIEQLPAVHQLPGAYADPLADLARLTQRLERYRDEERAALGELRPTTSSTSITNAADYAALAERWADAAQRIAEPYERTMGERSPWTELSAELRQALLSAEPRRLDNLLTQLATARGDGYQRARQRLRDAAPAPRPEAMLTTAQDSSAIATRAAGILQTLPEPHNGNTAHTTSDPLVLDWQRTLLIAPAEDPTTPRIAHRAAAINAMPDALRSAPDYQLITGAVARPPWFTMPMTGTQNQIAVFDDSTLREPWLAGGNDSPFVGDDEALPNLLTPIRSSLAARSAWIATNDAARLIREIVRDADATPTDRAIDTGLRRAVSDRRSTRLHGKDLFNGLPIPMADMLEVLGLEATLDEAENVAAFDALALAELRTEIERVRTAIANAAVLDQPTSDLLARIAARLDSLHAQSRAFWLAMPARLAESADRGRRDMPIFATALASTDWPTLRAALTPWLDEREYPVGRYQQALHFVLRVHTPETAAAYRALSDDPAWQGFIDAMTLPRRDEAGTGDWAELMTDLARQLVALGENPETAAPAARTILPREGPLTRVPTSQRVIEHIRRVLDTDSAPPDGE